MIKKIINSYKAIPNIKDNKTPVFYGLEGFVLGIFESLTAMCFIVFVYAVGTFLVANFIDPVDHAQSGRSFMGILFCIGFEGINSLGFVALHYLMQRKPTPKMYAWLQEYADQTNRVIDVLPETKEQFAPYVKSAYEERDQAIAKINDTGAFAKL